MNTIVMKFGGASLAKPQQFSQIASLILEKSKDYKRIAIVVSAMGNTTDQLIELAKQVHPNPPRREQDMLISAGERISTALLAMALELQGKEAISFTGSQSGIITNNDHSEAQIFDVRPHRLIPHLDAGKIVIVAGFQGVSSQGEITTLGRGGSDTSAVALGIALGAQRVEFYKDVPGIADLDPKSHPEAAFFSHMSYEEALSIINGGAKVLHARALLLAQKYGLPLHVLSFKSKVEGTFIRGEGTLSIKGGYECV